MAGEPAADPAPKTAWEECLNVTASIGRKADANKFRARMSVIIITGSTAAIPLCIGLATNSWIWGKAVPSILAATAALTSALVQLERPHERWKLYRRYHRTLEAEQLAYRFGSGLYRDSDDRDRLLAHRLAELQLRLHDDWESLLPGTAEVSAVRGEGA